MTFETAKRIIECLSTGVLNEAHQIKNELLTIRAKRTAGIDINLKDFSQTALNYYTKFSYRQSSNEQFELEIHKIIIVETEINM